MTTRLLPPMFLALAAVTAPTLAQDAGGQAGHDAKGFFLAQGDTRLNMSGFAQFRYMVNSRDDAGDNEEITQGFSDRRIRVIFSGDFSKQWGYKIDVDMQSDGSFKPADTFMSYKDGAWRFRGGQFKLPILKEELVADTDQLAVERSVVNSVFTGARSQGVDATYTDKQFRFMGMVSDGINQLNTPFTDEPADFAVTARGEYLWEGEDFKRFDSFAGWRGKGYSGMLGGAVHYQDGGETGGSSDASNFTYTVDASAKGDGWSVYAAFVGRSVETGGSDFNDMGWLVQGGYFVSDQAELFARFAHVMPDEDRSAGEDFKELTVGAAYYVFPESAALKITADVTIGLDDQAGASSVVSTSAANGLLASGEEQTYVRLQATFVF
ncbi:MAG: porin [Phycisphaerales bacterium]